MNIEDLSIFGLYSQKENKVIAALLLVWKLGWTILLRSFISSCAYFSVLPVFLLFKHQLRCREPVVQQVYRIYMYNQNSI